MVKFWCAAAIAATLPTPGETEIVRAEEVRDPNKLINTICAKLGQLVPGTINVLALSTDGVAYQENDVAQTMKLLKQHADHKDEDYFVRRGFASARDFLHDYQRLSAVLIRRGWDDSGALVLKDKMAGGASQATPEEANALYQHAVQALAQAQQKVPKPK